MARLPKSIIKKYGISKKAWSVYRRGKGSKSKVRTTTTTRSMKVAKRKTRRSYGKKQAPKSFMEKMIGRVARPATAVLYGYTRDKISDAIANSKLGQELPATRFTDEVTMIAIAFGARRAGLAGNRYGRMAIQLVEDVEWSRIGEELSDMQQEKKAAGGSTTTAMSSF